MAAFGGEPGVTQVDQNLVATARAALEEVKDPELDISLVGLGLIRDLSVQGGTAHVKLTFTSMGCPWTDMIRDSVREKLLSVHGVERVTIEDVWDRPWSPRDLRRDARARLNEIGIVTG
jgi:metal-sulfur cluster biosynthetic enzyme